MICGGPGCEIPIPHPGGPGRPQVFCSEACRKRRQRADRRTLKASDLVDLIRTVPTAVAIAALCDLTEADLDRALAIAAWKGRPGLTRKSGTRPASGNYINEIVTPSEDTQR